MKIKARITNHGRIGGFRLRGGWAVITTMDGSMCIYPQNDIRQHELEAPCWCNPFYRDGVLIHQSADRREEREVGAIFPQDD